MNNERMKKFTELYENLSSNYGKTPVFSDFVKMCAISIYNSFAKNKEMEQEYLKTINKYKKEHQELFIKMFSELIMMYEEIGDITDVLGQFYEVNHLNDKYLGQFFTAIHISEFTSEVVAGEGDSIKKYIENNGFVSITDPTCGAGRYVTCFCKKNEKRKY